MTAVPIRGITNEELRADIEALILDATDILGHLYPELGEIKFTKILNTNMDESHFRGRNWSPEDAIRDLLQNALDENEDVGKEFNPKEDIEKRSRYLIIKDHGRGLPIEAFSIGGTKNDDCHRGGFGEGLKLSLGTLILRGHRPIIFITKNKDVYVADFFEVGGKIGRGIEIPVLNRWLGILIGKSRRKPRNIGTAVIIPDHLDKLESIANRVLPKGKVIFEAKMPPVGLAGHFEGNSPLIGSCAKPYRILENEGLLAEPKVYIGGLYFHDAREDSMFHHKKTRYSYDLWANPETGEIESSRKSYTLIGPSKMAIKFYKLWDEFYRRKPKEAVRAFKEILERSSERSGRVLVIKDDIGELAVEPPERWEVLAEKPATKDMVRNLSELMKKAICELTGWDEKTLALFRISAHEIARLNNILYDLGDANAIVYNAQWPVETIPDYTEKLYEKMKELSKGKAKMEEFDDTAARCVLQTMALFFGDLPPIVHAGKVIERGERITLGVASIEDIPTPVEMFGSKLESWGVVRVAVEGRDGATLPSDRIIETLLHELAHVKLFMHAGITITIDDVTHEFEDALGNIAATAFQYSPAIRALAYGFLPCPDIPRKYQEWRKVAKDMVEAIKYGIPLRYPDKPGMTRVFLEKFDPQLTELKKLGMPGFGANALIETTKLATKALHTLGEKPIIVITFGKETKLRQYPVLPSNPFEMLKKMKADQIRALAHAKARWLFFDYLKSTAYKEEGHVLVFAPEVDHKDPRAYLKLIGLGAVWTEEDTTHVAYWFEGKTRKLEGSKHTIVEMLQGQWDKYKKLADEMEKPSLKNLWRNILTGSS